MWNEDWVEVSYDGETHKLAAVSSANGDYTGASRYGSADEHGKVALLQDETVHLFRRLPEPRSVHVSDTGRIIVADWIEYGDSTGADIVVWDKSGQEIFQQHLEESAPLVDISPDGRYIVICPYGAPAVIRDLDQGGVRTRYPYEIADRFTPKFEETTNGLELALANPGENEALYRIDLDGNPTWQSPQFELQQYYDVITLDESVSWGPAIEKCVKDYRAADDPAVRNKIANTTGEARLVDASPTLLREVTDLLESRKNIFSKVDAHWRLIHQTLGNAYYRLAKHHGRGTTQTQVFWEYLKHAANSYEDVLPWYEGKKGLAKTLRLQANTYRKQQRQAEAFACYEQILALEDKFDVALQSTGDKNRISEYREAGLALKEPRETGWFVPEGDRVSV